MIDSPENITVASWNLLLAREPGTKVAPQADRWDSFTATLGALDPRPDILALLEVENNPDSQQEMSFAEKLKYKYQAWASYGRPYEGMVLVHNQPDSNVEMLSLTPQEERRAAIVATMGKLTCVATHLSHQITKGARRTEQISQIIRGTEDIVPDLIMGDFNSLAWNKPRRVLRAMGLVSVVGSLDLKSPGTFPTMAYRRISVPPLKRPLVCYRISIDDIYFNPKRLKLIRGGLFEGDSDHKGVWATLWAA